MSVRRIGYVVFIFLCSFLEAQTFSISNFNLEINSFFVSEKRIPMFQTEAAISTRFSPTNNILMNLDISSYIDNITDFVHPLTEYRKPAYLYFDGASIQFPYINETTTVLSVFTGFFDDPSSSSLLRDYFKLTYTKPTFRSLPSGSVFDPQVDINGTGVALTGVPGNKNIAIGVYGYWKSLRNDEGMLTGTFRIARPGTVFSVNAYGGFIGEITTGKAFINGGFSSLLGSDSSGQLYIEAIIKEYSPGETRIDRNIHILFEPRIKGEYQDVSFTFFYSPTKENNTNFLGTNLLWGIGSIEKQKMRGGLSLLGTFNPENPGTLTPFSFSVTPFYSIMKGDFLFQIAATLNPLLMNDYRSAAKIQGTIKAVY
ncbi:MAG TPA: hypothetical protein VJ861_06610 [Treponemataceae bacterium]|nr:hypothetical protein [Treponemataceae bacterium]